jgi:peptidoglycan hydrolase-like protein with peptidoglycan-binding domain
MRGPQRAVIATVTTAGLVATLGLTATPSVAEPVKRPAATVDVEVSGPTAVGGKCSVTFSLSTDEGYVRDAVILQSRTSSSDAWKPVATYKTFASKPRTITRVVLESTSFRILHEPSSKAGRAADYGRCTVRPLGPGDSGSTVKKLQKRLRKLGVRPSSVNGRYDANTSQAVMAFQKHRKLPRTGRADLRTLQLISKAKRYKGPSWCRDSDRICIDISKQVAYLRTPEHKHPFLLPISSGNETYYRTPSGGTDFANTPRGRYKVWLKRPGMTKGDLGTYYWFSAFHRGWGVHGSNSVPSYPASHGCVRVPRSIEQWVYKNLPTGAYVNVHD